MKKFLILPILATVLCSTQSELYAMDPESDRDTFNYNLRLGNRIVYIGQTGDLEAREAAHRAEGKEFSKIEKVGIAKTEAGAIKAERDALARYRRNHGGENPKYNKTDHG